MLNGKCSRLLGAAKVRTQSLLLKLVLKLITLLKLPRDEKLTLERSDLFSLQEVQAESGLKSVPRAKKVFSKAGIFSFKSVPRSKELEFIPCKRTELSSFRFLELAILLYWVKVLLDWVKMEEIGGIPLGGTHSKQEILKNKRDLIRGNRGLGWK
ncbi:hypothetical protein VNO77_47152 [Canavalia gladiata]|uniref:Uncharacterized protein n=1 Tax=Canavalia gladiata TaxID=3824 RepID=A0AAN9JFL8_CANGL